MVTTRNVKRLEGVGEYRTVYRDFGIASDGGGDDNYCRDTDSPKSHVHPREFDDPRVDDNKSVRSGTNPFPGIRQPSSK